MKGSSIKDLFKEASYHSEMKLSEDIWRTISKKNERLIKIMSWVYLSSSILSLTGFIFIVRDLIVKLPQTGFYEYMSLLASDGKYIGTYWKEFMLSVTESLPVTNITLSLLLVFVLLFSIRKIILRKYKGSFLIA